MIRRVRLRDPLVTVTVVLASACADEAPTAPSLAAGSPSLAAASTKAAPAAPGRYLVGFAKPTTSIPSSVLAASGGQVVDAIPAFNVLVVDGVTNPSALAASGATYVEAEFETTLDAIPADGATPMAVPEAAAAPWYASGVQWDMKAMKADVAWGKTNGGEGMTICIVDTGLDAGHQELNGKVLARANFVTSPAVETVPTFIHDPHGHGTHVGGSAAARGTVISGVAPRANLLGARVLNTGGSGSETAIVNGIRWCADNGAHAINLSIGGIRYRGTAAFTTSPITYGNAVAYANNLGSVVIVSAGNSNLQFPNPGGAQITVPAQVAGALNVGATGPLTKVGTFTIAGSPTVLPVPVPGWNPFDANQVWQGPDTRAFYSNYGTGVGVFAPGGRGGVPLSSPYRFHNRVAQGIVHDAIWSSCSGQSSQSGAANVGGVPTGSASCNGQTNRYVAFNGTSMAAPHVAGMAAILYAELGGVRTNANRLRVLNCIKKTTDVVGPSSVYGGGRVNASKAVDAIRAGTC